METRTRQKEDNAPRNHRIRKGHLKRGLILIHTGAGKGKTTAAIGTALRTLGHGKRAAMVQFIKGKWKTGEAESIKQFGDRFQLFTMGEGFTWDTKSFERDVEIAKKTWAKCVEFLHDEVHDLVIFDEINYCFKYNFLETKEILKELKRKPPAKHVILTGNGAPPELIKIADLVTEMRCLKHPYNQGVAAQAGIEF